MLPEDESYAHYSRSPASTSACARMRPSTSTRWTSATAPGRSLSCCFGSSTMAPAPIAPVAPSACRSAAARCSTRTSSASSKAVESAVSGRRTSACNHPRLGRSRLPRAGKAARPRRRADWLRVRDPHGLRLETATGRPVAIKPAKSWARRTRSTSTRSWPSRTAAARSVLTAPSRTRSRWAPRRADGGRPARASLDRVLNNDGTPDVVPRGALVLQTLNQCITGLLLAPLKD